MPDENPLLPIGYDVAWAIAVVAVAALAAVALVGIARRRRALGPLPTAVWIAVVVLAPVLGALAWFVVGRGSERATTVPR